MRATPLLLMAFLVGGCSHDPSNEELAKVYRTGMTRAEVAELFKWRGVHNDKPLDVFQRPADGWSAAKHSTYSTDVVFSRFEKDHAVVVQTCEIWLIPRGRFIPFGAYFDYLWYGADDRLQGFWRRFID